MMLLLLSEVNNTTIFLMTLLNTIDGKNSCSLYRGALLSLLLAIENRPTWLVIMAWHSHHNPASQVFGNTFVKDKTIGWYCQFLASISLASASAAPCEQSYIIN
jgi:hypothetical protein